MTITTTNYYAGDIALLVVSPFNVFMSIGGEVLEYAKDNIAHCVSSTRMYGIRSS